MKPRVAVVIVSFNTRALTLEAVESVLAAEGVSPEIWVVDNASHDDSVEAIRGAHPQVRVMALEENVGFGRGNNQALEALEAPYVLLLNSDATFATTDGLRRLVDAMEQGTHVGVVGPRLQDASGVLEYSARAFPRIGTELLRGFGAHRLLSRRTREGRLASEFRDHARAGPAEWLTGACLLVRGEVIEEVGGFDPAIFMYGEELEWCWRVRKAGWDIVLEPGVTVVHRRGASGASLPGWRLRVAMAGDAYAVRKHRGWVYLGVFAVARVVGLLAEGVLQGVLGAASGQELRRRRSRYAFKALGAWLQALVSGGAVHPSAPAFRPPAARELP